MKEQILRKEGDDGRYGESGFGLLCNAVSTDEVMIVKASERESGYKPEGRGFETRWGEILNLPNPSGSTRPWGLLGL
jgi:hypothetical protein